MFILAQFVFRATFGLALGMAVTSPRQVTSGYYRNHLYVLLGLNVLAAMAAFTAGPTAPFSIVPPLLGAALSYVGAVAWLYERPRAGIVTLVLIAATALWGAWSGIPFVTGAGTLANLLKLLEPVTSGLVLGLTLAAMFLGHWYLNTPTMELAPLRKLVLLMALALAARAVVCATGLILAAANQAMPGDTQALVFIALRWLFGIFGAELLTVMSWETLKIPNTQAATGMLYVAVIATFLGELASLLVSQASRYPL